MANQNELNIIAPWIIHRLRNVPELVDIVGTHPQEGMVQTYEGVALEGATYPLVIARFMGGQYRNGAEGRRILVRARYDVFGVDQANSYGGDLAILSNLIVGELDLAQLLTTDSFDGHMIGCKCVAPIQGERFENEERTLTLGTTFEIQCRAAT